MFKYYEDDLAYGTFTILIARRLIERRYTYMNNKQRHLCHQNRNALVVLQQGVIFSENLKQKEDEKNALKTDLASYQRTAKGSVM